MTRLEALLLNASGQATALPDADTFATTPVPGEGPLNARIVVLGESLGHEEALQRKNFIGRSGQKLRNHMRLAGIHPEKCYIFNVYPFFPPGGSVENVEELVLKEWQEKAREQLASLAQAELIVCVGNVALETVTGMQGITRRRGSVYEWEGKKVIGIIHPAMVLRRAEYEKHSRLDWERVKILTTGHGEHSFTCGCARRLERRHITPFNTEAQEFEEAIGYYLKQAQNPQKILAIDIETPKIRGKRQIVCVSFAFSPAESLVLPYIDMLSVCDAPEHASSRFVDVALLCESPCIKLGHNFVSYDRWWLERAGVHVGGEIIDTLALHHCLDPASAHSLEYLTSVLTWEPFYKDEGKGHDITLIEKDMEGYYEYCGLDSCVTVEIYNRLWPELERRGMVNFYREHYEALFDPILDVMSQGVCIDHETRQTTLQALLRDARAARDRLGVLAGRPLFTLGTQRDQAVFAALMAGESLHGLAGKYEPGAINASLERIEKKTVSNTQLKHLLYDVMGLPLQTRRRQGGEETATADGVALRTLKLAYPDRPDVQEVIDLATHHNKSMKLASFLYPGTFDEDGMFRFTLKLNTEAGRLASSAAPNGTGRNSQNSPRDKRVRRVILPDQGHVLLECDAAQIECRIVFVRTKHPDLIRLGRAGKDFDQHAFTASLVFGKPVELVGKGTEERQLAKSIGHAAQRAMQGKTMADYLMKNNMLHPDNTPFDAEECDELLASYYRAFPGVPLWQQRIRREVRTTKRLVNRWGRVWDVRYEEINDDLFRKAYNFLPQCCDEATEILTRKGFIPFPTYMAMNRAQPSWAYDHVMQWSPESQELKFVLPRALHEAPYTGDMIYMSGVRVSSLVTPNHRIVYTNKEGATHYVKSAEDLIGHTHLRVPVCGEYKEETREYISPAVAQLLVATQADAKVTENRVAWHLKKDRKITRLYELLNHAGVAYTECKLNDGTVEISTAGVWPALVKEWLPNKQFTLRLLQLPRNIRRNIVVEAGLWDSRRNWRTGTTFSYVNTDEQSVDVLQVVASCSGYRAFKSVEPSNDAKHKTVFSLTFAKETTAQASKQERVPYSGTVYCVTVPSGFFVARREGRVFITGNSECADLTNRCFFMLWRHLKDNGMQSRILMQEHDALLCSCPPQEVYDVACFMQEHIGMELDYDGVALRVPVEFKIGLNWGDAHELVELPTRDVTQHLADKLLQEKST